MKNLRNIIFLIAAGLHLSGCGGSDSLADLKTYIKNAETAASHDTSRPTPPLPTPPVSIKYTADESRKPFANTMQRAKNKQMSTNPLQNYSLSVLQLVGTIKEGNQLIAYIQAPDNKIYSVKEGDPMGDNGGKIVAINHDRIDIAEMTITDTKLVKQKIVTLLLKEAN